MNGKIIYGITLLLGAASLILLVANVALINSNRHLQDEATQRQADINKGGSLAQLNQNLVQALADASITGNDTAIRDLLAAQGITFKANPPTTAKIAAPDAKPSTGKK